MKNHHQTNWQTFRFLCEILSGHDKQALARATSAQVLPQLFDMARNHDLLPALAVRYSEQTKEPQALNNTLEKQLKQALLDNTLRNMQIIVQTLELTKQLNQAGITPLLLKGTAQLLSTKENNLGFRKQIDIDVLVKPSEIETASKVFLALGYHFYQFSQGEAPKLIPAHNTEMALKAGAHHHHLPPLAKIGFAATVELHRHFLPKRFQSKTHLESIFNTAHQKTDRGAIFLIPSVEYQLIHLILGKIVHDGHLARHTFPIREACDYLFLLEKAGKNIDQELLIHYCGKNIGLFSALVNELMTNTPIISTSGQRDVSKYIAIMQKRYNMPITAKVLDMYARALHLSNALIHNPAKLPGYLRRLTNKSY